MTREEKAFAEKMRQIMHPYGVKIETDFSRQTGHVSGVFGNQRAHVPVARSAMLDWYGNRGSLPRTVASKLHMQLGQATDDLMACKICGGSNVCPGLDCAALTPRDCCPGNCQGRCPSVGRCAAWHDVGDVDTGYRDRPMTKKEEMAEAVREVLAPHGVDVEAADGFFGLSVNCRIGNSGFQLNLNEDQVREVSPQDFARNALAIYVECAKEWAEEEALMAGYSVCK